MKGLALSGVRISQFEVRTQHKAVPLHIISAAAALCSSVCQHVISWPDVVNPMQITSVCVYSQGGAVKYECQRGGKGNRPVLIAAFVCATYSDDIAAVRPVQLCW